MPRDRENQMLTGRIAALPKYDIGNVIEDHHGHFWKIHQIQAYGLWNKKINGTVSIVYEGEGSWVRAEESKIKRVVSES